MRILINYFRECFCKHDFEREQCKIVENISDVRREGMKVSATCKKCGFHKSYWKYLN